MMRGTHRPQPIVLDLGSGGRSLPGVISMEYVEHPDNSLQGDCLALPFRDNSVDLILSQAVLEHVTNPDAAMAEMNRVLKPGGLLYVEIAFMQPVHQAPWHYFNVTPHGLTWMLRDWEILEQGTCGTTDEVLEWIMKAYWGFDSWQFIRGARHRGRHPLTLPANYELAASGVTALARKR
jgi:SAM-dependent methyltransferase